MEEIMEKLGVELDEKFSVKIPASAEFYDEVMFAKYSTTNNIVLAEIINGVGIESASLLINILNGEATIVKKPWNPSKMGETYWYVNIYGKVDYTTYDTASDTDRLRLMVRNCYQTVEEAEEHVDYWKHVYKDMPEFKEVEK